VTRSAQHQGGRYPPGLKSRLHKKMACGAGTSVPADSAKECGAGTSVPADPHHTRRSFHRRWTIAPSLVWGAAYCACAVLSVSAAAQSLADVARAEAERRKTIAQPSRVYTNRDLKPVPGPVPAPPAEAGDTSPDVAPSAARKKRNGPSPGAASRRPPAETGDDLKDPEEDADTTEHEEERRKDDEQRWRARMAEARDQVRRSRMFADALQSRINALNADFSARDDPAQRSVIGTELNKALAELERVRGDIEAQDKAVTDLEEEARRSGVPPGWLR
jgi:hypothetical protein